MSDEQERYTPPTERPGVDTGNTLHTHDPRGEETDSRDVTRGLSVDDAYSQLEERAKEAREEDAHVRETSQREEQEAAKREINEAGSWTADDKAVIGSVAARKAKFDSDVGVYNRSLAEAAKIQQAGGHVPHDVLRTLHDAHARLQVEQAALTDAGAKIKQAAELKPLARAQAELMREVPELKSQEARNELVEFAVKKGWTTRSQAMAERDPAVIKQAWTAMQAEKAEQRSAAKAEAVAEYGRKHHRVGSILGTAGTGIEAPRNSSEAMERLKRSGTIDDGLAFLKMRQMERE